MNRSSIVRVVGMGAAFGVILFITSIDFITKFFAESRGFGVCNEGISFGITLFSEPVIIIIFVIVILSAIIYLFPFKIGSSLEVDSMWIGLALIVAGGFANLVSRLERGCVWDWISLGIGNIQFNLADVAIDVGLVLFTLGVAVIMYKDWRHGKISQKSKGGR